MSEQILAKVKRLMALSNNNSNVNEAANAYKAAQKLLSENRLSMADVDSLVEESDEEEVEASDEGLYVGKRAITWKGSLAMGIAQCNGCDVYWNHTYKEGIGRCKQLKVVGRQSDIDIVRWLYSSVSTQIESLCKIEMTFNGGGGKTFSNNFKKGATSAVVARLVEAKREVEQKYADTTALVLVKNKDAEVSKFMGTLGLRKTKTTSRFDSSGYDAGRAAGKRVNLTRGGLGDGTTKRRLN
jgi:hypothetical protein